MTKIDPSGVSYTHMAESGAFICNPDMEEATEFYTDTSPDNVIIQANGSDGSSTIMLNKEATARLCRELISAMEVLE